MKRIDLVGQVFGKLTVVDKFGKNKSGGILWSCKCECGNIKRFTTHRLKNGVVTSCGCEHKPKYIDLVGQKFGELIVISATNDRSKNGNMIWERN